MNIRHHIICFVVFVALTMLWAVGNRAATAQTGGELFPVRELMVRREVIGRGVRDPRVIQAMRAVPRHEFVPAGQRKYAYADAAIPIGDGQTITSPFVVAFMTEKLAPQPTDKVLEIGTGSGYQASVLSFLVADVYTIEIVESLGRKAARTVQRLGYDNIHCRIGDGYQGWPQHAPFDKIIVTCSPEDVPPALVQQLREGGLLIIPLGERFQQSLYLFQKVQGKLQKQRLQATFFVPMTGRAEQERLHTGDAGVPEVSNGDFEQQGTERQGTEEEVTGWFYARQARVVPGDTSGEGSNILLLTNQTPGQVAHVHQPVGCDGRQLPSITFSARVRTVAVRGTGEWSLPRVELAFYDENRAAIRTVTLGPWQGSRGWQSVQKSSPVPDSARFAVISVTMLGATGQFAVDDIKVQWPPLPAKLE